MTRLYLGKNISKSNQNNKIKLDRIERKKSSIKYGIDIWNSYEFFYLNEKGEPESSILEIIIPCLSEATVESKSLKLYLNSFHDQSFKSKNEIIKCLKTNLSNITCSKVKISFKERFNKPPKSIDIQKTSIKYSKYNSTLCFKSFRSICPVTSQPDFATVYVYSSAQIDIFWLKDYLSSYKDNGEFHEECIENIFNDIKNKYNPKKLQVYGRFLRRGGIDINPLRSSHKKFIFSNHREYNQ